MSLSDPQTAEEDWLDPGVARFVSEILAGSPDPTGAEPSTLPGQRAAAELSRQVWGRGGPAMRRTEDMAASCGAVKVRVRVLQAGESEGRRPALVYLHGGGFTLFSLETHDRLMREYAARSDAIVVGVDYSLSPEAKFPTALHEVVAVLDWLVGAGPALGIDPERLAIGGDSAGANLALAACLTLRDRGEPLRIGAMLLNYGFFDADFETGSQRRHGGSGKLLTTAELAGYLDNYLGGTPHWQNPLALPALAELHDLPPSFHVIAECDPLADGDRRLAERLQEAGAAVVSRVYRGATHSFLEAVSISAVAEQAFAESADWLRAVLAPADAGRSGR